MKNKYLFGLLGLLGFSSCSSDQGEGPCYYGPGPNWSENELSIASKVENEYNETINGIQVIASYVTTDNKTIADTAYTQKQTVDGSTSNGLAVNKLKFDFSKIDLNDLKITLTYNDVDGEENSSYLSKSVIVQDEVNVNKVILQKVKDAK